MNKKVMLYKKIYWNFQHGIQYPCREKTMYFMLFCFKILFQNLHTMGTYMVVLRGEALAYRPELFL